MPILGFCQLQTHSAEIPADIYCKRRTILQKRFVNNGSSSPQAPQVIVTSSGRTVKRRFQLLDDDPAQEVLQPTHTLKIKDPQ